MDSTCSPRISRVWKSQSSQSSSGTNRFSFPSHQRDVPQAWNPARVLFDGDLHLEPLQQLPPSRIVLQVLAQLAQGREHNRRADEEHRLVLQGGHDDLVRRANAVNIRWAIRDSKITRVHHAQINVERL